MIHSARPKVAIALEYPLEMRAGVSVIVKELILGLSSAYRIVLVSPDRAIGDGLGENLEHLIWEPQSVSRKTSKDLAQRLAESGVQLAHFHFGALFGWGARLLGSCPIPLVARLGIPVLSTVHSVRSVLDDFCGPEKPLLFKLAILPAAWAGRLYVLKHNELEVAVSLNNLNKLRLWYWPLRRRFTRIYHSRIHAGATVDEPKSIRQSVILNVGYVSFVKGQHLLTKAFARLAQEFPAWRLVLVGDVSEDAALQSVREIISEENLGHRVSILEGQSRIEQSMSSAAVFAMPSLHEGLGLALQEAMYYGCACVGSNVGGIPELIRDGDNGLLVEPGNVDQLTRGLHRLMSDQRTCQKFGDRARRSILEKDMTASAMVQSYRRLYEQLLSKSRSGYADAIRMR